MFCKSLCAACFGVNGCSGSMLSIPERIVEYAVRCVYKKKRCVISYICFCALETLDDIAFRVSLIGCGKYEMTMHLR